jgi:hypothetical protein
MGKGRVCLIPTYFCGLTVMSVSTSNPPNVLVIVGEVQKAIKCLKEFVAERCLPPRKSRSIVEAIWSLEDLEVQFSSLTSQIDSKRLKENETELRTNTTKRVHNTESEDSVQDETDVINSKEKGLSEKIDADPGPDTPDHSQTHHDEEKPDTSKRDILKRAIRQNMQLYLDGNTIKSKPREPEEPENSAAKSSKSNASKSLDPETSN